MGVGLAGVVVSAVRGVVGLEVVAGAGLVASVGAVGSVAAAQEEGSE
jgi:hypothetical protein